MIRLSIIWLITISFNISFGQNNSNHKGIGKIFVSDFTNAADVGFATFKQPLEFTNNDWLTLGSIIGGTALLSTLDKNIRKSVLLNQTSSKDKVFNFDSFYGNVYTAFFAGGLYGIGLVSGQTQLREVGLQATEAFIISGLVTGILKVIIGRRRPYIGDSNYFFKPFQLTDNDYQALPSGHSTVAFAVSAVMANSIDNIIWKTFWYGSAGMVALSRMYHNQHWASDVFFGSAVGYFVGKFIVNINKTINSNTSGSNLTPIISFNQIGLKYSF